MNKIQCFNEANIKSLTDNLKAQFVCFLIKIQMYLQLFLC